ncbi:putative wsc domain-containing protein [Phaeoacremonium minimum UCRPA7]|uniref:Putative wsc domain-containing protein n=1 Tax=Phaeoacremonium minimum (strain UCR-PA7) TaxID=1286976 RepID=R8BYJ1_PHAM7|nr:putative wsc domain-containing protein [Phaeoacremonium minimum UCRPA7]EOO04428.1 putative wsc domain-containing protein [Phaeoacremonium minimum UCRPA7]
MDVVAACFKNAGWPGAMDCFDFSSWCSDIGSYCTSASSRGGKCNKGDAWKSKPPKGGNSPTTSTSVYTCKPTSTSTTSTKKTSSTSSSTTKCPVPTATGICKQPTNNQYGYGPGNPVGDIDLPILTCNDLKDDFSKYPFKLYTDSDSKKCGGYSRPSVPNACADACKAQYDQCQDTYATGCKEKNGVGSSKSGSSGSSSWWPFWKRSAFPGSYFDYIKAPNKRTFGWTDTYTTASSKCTAQYNDCLSQNKGVSAGTKCTSYGTGW